MCLTKKCYRSEDVALEVAARCKAARGVPLRPYWCGAHQAWHLTKTRAVLASVAPGEPCLVGEAPEPPVVDAARQKAVARAIERRAKVRALRRAAGLQQAAELLRRNGWTCIPPEDCA